nr:GapR family DNA-binding domain-containing protein [Ensifer sp. ENS02]
MSAEGQIKAFIDRILRLKEEQDVIGDDIRDIYAEAARAGICKTTLGMKVRDEKQRAEGCSVYFAAFPTSGLLKIGISRDVLRRMDALSYQRGERAELIGSFPATYPMEGWCHVQFGAWRLFGEYFALNDTTRQMALEILELEKSKAEAA